MTISVSKDKILIRLLQIKLKRSRMMPCCKITPAALCINPRKDLRNRNILKKLLSLLKQVNLLVNRKSLSNSNSNIHSKSHNSCNIKQIFLIKCNFHQILIISQGRMIWKIKKMKLKKKMISISTLCFLTNPKIRLCCTNMSNLGRLLTRKVTFSMP